MTQTQRRAMTEAKAWRILARVVDKRSHEDCNHFLCCAVENERDDIDEIFIPIPYPMRSAMRARIRSHDFGHGFLVPAPWCDTTQPRQSHNRARVLFCLWMALDAEEEARCTR